MHEASLMKGLMSRIDTLAAEAQARRVTGVSVWLGALSHMSPEHFREHFLSSSIDSCAAGASLQISTSSDVRHPEAEQIRLLSIEVES